MAILYERMYGHKPVVGRNTSGAYGPAIRWAREVIRVVEMAYQRAADAAYRRDGERDSNEHIWRLIDDVGKNGDAGIAKSLGRGLGIEAVVRNAPRDVGGDQ